MLRVDPTLNHIPARREHVVSLYESINQPLVNIPNHGTAPTGAFLLGTRNEHGFYTVFVYLHQPETRAVIIYVSEPRNLSAEQFRVEETEAVRFVESMGFMVDSVHFRQLGPAEQDAVIARVPIFRPPSSTLDLYEVADDQIQQIGVQQPDAIFGSMGASGDEVFRRAGLSMPPTPAGTSNRFTGAGPMSGFGNPTPTGQRLGGMNAMSGMTGMGANPYAQPMHQGAMQPMQHQTPLQHQAPLQQMHGQPLHSQQLQQQMAPMPPQQTMPPMSMSSPSMPPPSLSQPSMLSQAQPQAPMPPHPQHMVQPTPQQTRENAEALERLGRLLGAFSLLFALSVSLSACKTVSTQPELESGTQNQVDIGEQQLSQQRWADAIGTFSEVLKEHPNEKYSLRGTGLAYVQLGRKDEAEPYYRRAIDADPKWSEPKNELAGLLIASSRCEEAEKLLVTVTQDIFYATPEYAQHNLALAMSCQGRQAEAVTKLETLMPKHPQFCLGYLTLSQLSAQTKQHETTVKACEDFDRYCARNEIIRQQVTPDLAAVCYLRSGMAHAQMGDVESARTSFLRCQSTGSAMSSECEQALTMLPQ